MTKLQQCSKLNIKWFLQSASQITTSLNPFQITAYATPYYGVLLAKVCIIHCTLSPALCGFTLIVITGAHATYSFTITHKYK